jgi:hypothetical protein
MMGIVAPTELVFNFKLGVLRTDVASFDSPVVFAGEGAALDLSGSDEINNAFLISSAGPINSKLNTVLLLISRCCSFNILIKLEKFKRYYLIFCTI